MAIRCMYINHRERDAEKKRFTKSTSFPHAGRMHTRQTVSKAKISEVTRYYTMYSAMYSIWILATKNRSRSKTVQGQLNAQLRSSGRWTTRCRKAHGAESSTCPFRNDAPLRTCSKGFVHATLRTPPLLSDGNTCVKWVHRVQIVCLRAGSYHLIGHIGGGLRVTRLVVYLNNERWASGLHDRNCKLLSCKIFLPSRKLSPVLLDSRIDRILSLTLPCRHEHTSQKGFEPFAGLGVVVQIAACIWIDRDHGGRVDR